MSFDLFGQSTKQIPSNLTCGSVNAGAVRWRSIAQEVCAVGGRFLTLWGADDRDRDGRFRVYALYLLPERKVAVVGHEMASGTHPIYPSLADLFPFALRMERAAHDLLGIASTEPDKRGWLRHGGWPETVFPLRREI